MANAGEDDSDLDDVGEGGPAILVAWDIENLKKTVDNINGLPPGPQGFLGLFHFPITMSDLEKAIMDHVAEFTGGDNIGNGLIAPNSWSEAVIVHGRLCELGLFEYPKWLHHENMLCLPLGRIFVVGDKVQIMYSDTSTWICYARWSCAISVTLIP